MKYLVTILLQNLVKIFVEAIYIIVTVVY